MSSLRKDLLILLTPALAGVLALLLIWAGTVASTPWHATDHTSDASPQHRNCPACQFAHGQLVAPDLAPVEVVQSTSLELRENPIRLSFPCPLDFRLPDDRAPPNFFS